jgi:hypothetical protein
MKHYLYLNRQTGSITNVSPSNRGLLRRCLCFQELEHKSIYQKALKRRRATDSFVDSNIPPSTPKQHRLLLLQAQRSVSYSCLMMVILCSILPLTTLGDETAFNTNTNQLQRILESSELFKGIIFPDFFSIDDPELNVSPAPVNTPQPTNPPITSQPIPRPVTPSPTLLPTIQNTIAPTLLPTIRRTSAPTITPTVVISATPSQNPVSYKNM